MSTAGSERRRPFPVVGPLLVLALSATAVSAAAAVTVVLAAAATGSWPLSVGAGATALVLSGVMLARMARSRWDRRSAGRTRPLVARAGRGPLALIALAAVLSTSWLVPRTPGDVPASEVDVRWVGRPDGSRLAVHVTRAPRADRPPLIVVHGGPGVADMATDAAAFGALATDRDVWVYDQVGAGSSTRLADVTGYTTERAVEDLAAVRRATGAPRVVLLGHSWGARIVTVYLARRPEDVAATVLSSPGQTPVGQVELVPGDPTTRLDMGQRAQLYARLLSPRNLFTYALTAADPDVAHRTAGDREMDARFADIYGRTRPALFCDADNAGLAGTDGVGFYAAQLPQLHPDGTVVPPSAVAGLTVPVLVIRPECDYIPAEVTDGNVQALPTARLAVLPDAGHLAYLERPTAYADLVSAFLAEEG